MWGVGVKSYLLSEWMLCGVKKKQKYKWLYVCILIKNRKLIKVSNSKSHWARKHLSQHGGQECQATVNT